MTKSNNLNKDKINPLVKKDSRLQGILWDLLRLQFKIAITAGIAFFLVIMIGQNYVSSTVQSSEPIYYQFFRLGHDVVLVGIFIGVFVLIFLTVGWIYAYPYGLHLKRTISYLIYQLKQFQRGAQTKKITVNRKDEMKKLAEQINELTDDLQQQMVSMRRVLNENAKLIEDAEKVASLDERRKLARDLHDAVSQELFAVSMSLGAIPKVLHSHPEKAEALFKQVEKMVQHSQQELRALIMHLRPVTLEGKSLKNAMESLMEELCHKHPNLNIQYNLNQLPEMDKGVEEQVFRVLQEGLSNALRHANPSSIKLNGILGEQRLLLTLQDDGIGFITEKVKAEKTGNYGLSSMKERIVELGGHFTIISYPQQGTKLEFRIPIVKKLIEKEGKLNE